MQSLINFTLLELTNDIHIFFTDSAILEIVEFSRVVGEVEEVDTSLMLFVEAIDVCLHI